MRYFCCSYLMTEKTVISESVKNTPYYRNKDNADKPVIFSYYIPEQYNDNPILTEAYNKDLDNLLTFKRDRQTPVGKQRYIKDHVFKGYVSDICDKVVYNAEMDACNEITQVCIRKYIPEKNIFETVEIYFVAGKKYLDYKLYNNFEL